ncbi:MAG: hypothetical protein IKG08_02015, partial [Eubacterium sp.]|nr:hypothetical protein [Eubacterium sp.]
NSPQQASKRIAPKQLFAPHQPFSTAVFFMDFTPIPVCSFCRYGGFAIPGQGPKQAACDRKSAWLNEAVGAPVPPKFSNIVFIFVL